MVAKLKEANATIVTAGAGFTLGAEDPGSTAFTMVVRDIDAAVDQWTGLISHIAAVLVVAQPI